MKQIDIIKTYGRKQCLVVDNSPDQRTSIKNMLSTFGAETINTSGSAEEAIELCRYTKYDLVISHYDLGKGKNGQQLLEELRFEGLLSNTAVYVIVSSETNTQYVLHALENQPDDYISEALNTAMLRSRLDQALMRNEALWDAKTALDQKKPEKATEACQKVISENTQFAPAAKKMLAELLCAQGHYEQVKTMLGKIAQDKLPMWGSLALSKAHIGLGEFEEAKSRLNALIESKDYCVEAKDLMAQALEAQGKFAQAQMYLEDGVTHSPFSPQRQREMARVSMRAGDKNAAVHAFRAAFKQSKNTCQERAEDGLNFADGLRLLSEDRPDLIDELAEEALETLAQVEKKFGMHPVVKIRQKLIEADIYEKKKDKKRVDDALSKASATRKEMKISVLENTSTNLAIDCAKAFMAYGKSDEGEALLQEIATINEDQDLRIQIDKLLREPVTKEGIHYAAKLNKKGIKLYQQEAIQEAILAFLDVLSELPNHVGINLNLIQALITKSKTQVLNEHEKTLISNSFKRIGGIEQQSPHHKRFEYLIKHAEKVLDEKPTGT